MDKCELDLFLFFWAMSDEWLTPDEQDAQEALRVKAIFNDTFQLRIAATVLRLSRIDSGWRRGDG
jgi:hypothetical protein